MVQPLDDAVREEEAGEHRGRRRRARHGQDLDVVAHVEHDPAGEEHGAERQHDCEQREPGELQADRGEKLEEQGHDQADPERGRRDDERELDHGENR